MIRYFKDLKEVRHVTKKDDYKLVTDLQKLKKDISKMKVGKEYAIITNITKSKKEKTEGKLIYKDKDIFTIQTKHYAESFRVLDFFDNTIEVLK